MFYKPFFLYLMLRWTSDILAFGANFATFKMKINDKPKTGNDIIVSRCKFM